MDQPTNAALIEQLGAGTGTFAAKMGEISRSVIMADHEGEMLHLDFLRGVAQMPNLVVTQREDLGFGLGEIARRDERPAFIAINTERLAFNEVNMSFDMTVGSKTSAMKETEAKAGIKSETQVNASGGLPVLGPRVGVKNTTTMTADVRHTDKQTRDTDMSAKVHIDANMKRQANPEGLMQMSDCANEHSRKVNELRLKVASAKVDRAIEQLESGELDVDELEAKGVEDADQGGQEDEQASQSEE